MVVKINSGIYSLYYRFSSLLIRLIKQLQGWKKEEIFSFFQILFSSFQKFSHVFQVSLFLSFSRQIFFQSIIPCQSLIFPILFPNFCCCVFPCFRVFLINSSLFPKSGTFLQVVSLGFKFLFFQVSSLRFYKFFQVILEKGKILLINFKLQQFDYPKTTWKPQYCLFRKMILHQSKRAFIEAI